MVNVLLGTAIGDALGKFAESKPANYPPLLNWDGKTFLPSEHHNLAANAFTDDTQFSITLAQSLIDCNGFDPDDISKRYVELFTSNTIRGYGRTTLMAIENLQAGHHWSVSGILGSWGNGTAMRAAPFGVFYKDDLYGLIEAATIDAKITHNSVEAVAGSLAIALAVYFIINKNEHSMIDNIVYHLPESEVKNKLLSLPSLLLSDKTPTETLQIIDTKADVRCAVPVALYCYLKFKNYPDAIVAAIRGGKDTDTNSAITGALCGAKYDMQGIPQEWINQIEDRDKLINLDSQLIA